MKLPISFQRTGEGNISCFNSFCIITQSTKASWSLEISRASSGDSHLAVRGFRSLEYSKFLEIRRHDTSGGNYSCKNKSGIKFQRWQKGLLFGKSFHNKTACFIANGHSSTEEASRKGIKAWIIIYLYHLAIVQMKFAISFFGKPCQTEYRTNLESWGKFSVHKWDHCWR